MKEKLGRFFDKLPKKNTLYGTDFLQTWDKTLAELEAVLAVAQMLRRLREERRDTRIFSSGMAISWFRDKSTRTRYSFAAAANLLGLSVSELDEEKSQVAHGETVRETATMLAYLTEIFGIRDDIFLGEGHSFMQDVTRAVDLGHNEGILSGRPSVINLQSDRDHPTQSLADLLHLVSQFGNLNKLRGKKLVMSWAYSPSYGKPLSVAQGVCGLMTRLGMDVVLAYPDGYGLIPELERMFGKEAKDSKGSFTIVHDMKKAFRDADVIYPKSWAPYAVMEERTRLLRAGNKDGLLQLEKQALAMNAKHKDWECTENMMRLTRGGKALYMHCLPADVSGVSCREGEVAKSVFGRYRKELFLQAGYKPDIIAAMILLTRVENPALVLSRMSRGRSL